VIEKTATRRYAYITDSRAGEFPKRDTVRPSSGGDSSGYAPNVVWYNICWPKEAFGLPRCDANDYAPGKKWREDYMAGLWKELDEKYNYRPERIKDISTCFDRLKETVELYKAAAG
jgi:hypothetical protein